MRSSRLIARGRRFAVKQMRATCVIGEEIRGREMNASGDYPMVIDPVYSGLCRVRFVSAITRDETPQGQVVLAQEPLVWIPVDEPGSELVIADMIGTVTEAEDPVAGMLGRRWRIRGQLANTDSVSRRFGVEMFT